MYIYIYIYIYIYSAFVLLNFPLKEFNICLPSFRKDNLQIKVGTGKEMGDGLDGKRTAL